MIFNQMTFQERKDKEIFLWSDIVISLRRLMRVGPLKTVEGGAYISQAVGTACVQS